MDIKDDILGKYIQQVCFGLYQIQLHLNDDIFISTGNILEYYSNGAIIQTWNGDKGRDNFCLNSVLELTIINAYIDDGKDLFIFFENGEHIKILYDKDAIESYMITYRTSSEII